jgi:hypothetical protein
LKPRKLEITGSGVSLEDRRLSKMEGTITPLLHIASGLDVCNSPTSGAPDIFDQAMPEMRIFMLHSAIMLRNSCSGGATMIVVPAETLLDEAIGQGLGLAKKIALKMADADHVKKLSGPEALLLFVDAIKLHETQHESENGRQEKGGRFGWLLAIAIPVR